MDLEKSYIKVVLVFILLIVGLVVLFAYGSSLQRKKCEAIGGVYFTGAYSVQCVIPK